MIRRYPYLLLPFFLLSFRPPLCEDWGFYAHKKLNELAIYTLPPKLIGFYKEHLEEIREHAVDPDKRRYAVRGEAVRHYIDLDHWGKGALDSLPRDHARAIWRTAVFYWVEDRDSLLVFDTMDLEVLRESPRRFTEAFRTARLMLRSEIPEREGLRWLKEHALAEYDEYDWLLPGAIASELTGTQLSSGGQLWIDDRFSKHGILPYFFPQHYRRLIKAFEARNLPAIVRLSADIGHYIGDAHVPLHTTKNYNGQLTGQEGIHAFWESRIPELFAEEEFDFLVGRSSFLPDPEAFIWNVVRASHQGVDSVLSIEKRLSQSLPADLQYCYETRLGVVTKLPCRDYARLYHEQLDRQVEARFRACILAIGSVWYSAWTEAGQPDLSQSSGDWTEFNTDEGKAVDDRQRSRIRVHE